MLLIEPAVFVERRQLVRVWRNEFTRVICDRLNGDADIGLMRGHLQEAIQAAFPGGGGDVVPELLDEMGREYLENMILKANKNADYQQNTFKILIKYQLSWNIMKYCAAKYL